MRELKFLNHKLKIKWRGFDLIIAGFNLKSDAILFNRYLQNSWPIPNLSKNDEIFEAIGKLPIYKENKIQNEWQIQYRTTRVGDLL